MAKGLKTGGRKFGTPNKITTDLKDAIMQAFDRAGGVAYLRKVAAEQPQVFCTLLGKVLPMQVTGKDDAPLGLAELIDASYRNDKKQPPRLD